ncbi:MAG: saccharopine dehydrogenase C-terminal domain-containing protein [Acidobacteriota bacterium]
MRIVVLGGGRVGAAIVRDLAADSAFEVTVVDASERTLATFGDIEVACRRADLSSPDAVRDVVAEHDLVIGAVPGPMGFATVRAVIEAGVDIVDISFFEEDAFELDALARERGVTVLVDCGVAPGASNLALGHAETTFDRVDRFVCHVGGLPTARHWPWEYKAPFSPIDVIAEYTRPVRLRENGRELVRPALSNPERVHFDGIGTLEAFETDGLRSLLHTSEVPNLMEKTLRYPGHREKIEVLRDTGLFSEEPKTLRDGSTVRPIDLAAELLFEQWFLEPGDDELTVMRIEIEGERDGAPTRRVLDLLDRTDHATGTSSMARTTGYTCTAMARLVAEGSWTGKGVAPPELVGRRTACYDRVMALLAERNVTFRIRES